MAISQQIIVVATLVAIFTGFANAYSCRPGFKDCDNDILRNGCETAIASDSNNCGNCGVVCPDSPLYSFTTPTCSKSKCGLKCLPEFADCNGVFNETDACETNIKYDPMHCGGCGRECPTVPDPKFAYATCNDGKCGIECFFKSPKQHCNKDWANTGCDVDLLNDDNNCGRCGNSCLGLTSPLPQVTSKCVKGKCKFVCQGGWENCKGNFKKNGCETSLQGDANNCGECGRKCPPPTIFIGGEPTCRKGTCWEQCKAGTTFNGKHCV